jgi:PAS domain S-box-containing protein
MYAAFTDGEVHHVIDEVLWRKDGTSFPVEFTSTPIRKEGELVGAVVTFKDITERKHAEAEIKASEERVRAILGSVVDAMITIDEEGIIQTYNDAAVWIFGYQLAEVVGRNIKMLMPEPDKSRHDTYLSSYMQTGKANILGESREVRGQRKDGSIFPMSLAVSELRQDGVVIFTGIVRDITRFKAAEGARRESEERLSTAIETIGDGFALYDSDDRLVLWNSKFVENFSEISEIIVEGVRFEDIIRTAAHRGLIPEARSRIDEWVEKRLKDRLLPFNVIEQELDGDRWIRTLERRTWDGGRVAIDVDITPFKQAEEQMRGAREQAEAANQAKSEFLANMSHELRTPMNAILGFGQLLKYETKDPLSASHRDSVEQILKGGEHLLELINEILDLAKIEARKVTLSIEDVPLGPLIEECLTLVQPLVESYGIQPILLVPTSEGHMLHADYTRVKQVLLNLLSNAIKYNNAGGTVTVSCQEGEAGMLRFNVADTGPGIPEDKLESLFEPFNRLGAETTEVEGTGIGLTLTRELVGLMKGKISVQSTVGEGTVFSVDLPRADKQIPVMAGAPEPKSPPQGLDEPLAKTWTLLYVEDNPANMRLMEEIINSVPRFRLVTANNAEDGIRLAAARNPDIIVMDINLPGMDGFEALKCLKGSLKTRSIPVIALSANAMPADIQKGRDAGFLEYLTKPVKIDEFLLAVDQVLDR